MGPLDVMILVGLLRWHACMLRELHSGELLYRSYRFIKEIVEVFMDDFSFYGKTFMDCLENLDDVLARCAEVDLVLNWEKCHFMVK
jgi:hypothetical protein